MTNKFNLPKALFRAIELDTHRAGGDVSTTQLLKSPREFWLSARHKDEIEVDCISNLWALFGTASHAVAERGETEDSLVEEYFKIEFGDISLTGSADLYEDGTLYDYKTLSVPSVFFFLDNQKKAQFIGQLNTYGYAFKKAFNLPVNHLKILALMRDWVSSKAKFDPSYPDFQAQVIDIPVLTEKQQLEYILNRIERLMKYKNTPDDELPECTEAYRWAKNGVFKVYKGANKSAVRGGAKFENREDAEKFIESLDTKFKYRIEEVKGDLFKRCEYCSAHAFCNQTEYSDREWRRSHQEIKVEMSFNQFMEETKQW